MFIDRRDAGKQLAKKLFSKRESADVVIGLAHGGVAVASEISKLINIPLDVLIVKKIGTPGNPELAIGARVPVGQRLDVRNTSIILVDDGAATGATMCAAVRWMREHKAKKIIVALPVAPPEVDATLRTMADDVVVLATPSDFGAVGAFYKSFPQLSDKDVVELLT